MPRQNNRFGQSHLHSLTAYIHRRIRIFCDVGYQQECVMHQLRHQMKGGVVKSPPRGGME